MLTLTWVDNSNSENGFRIERRIGTSGSYQQYAQVAANALTYTDTNVSGATAYCYRMTAFNSVGTSGFSNEDCATTLADTFALTASRAGSGSGTITSSPAGINCSSDCAENYPGGTVVTLTATAASGSTFAGWSGNADCTDGSVTVNASLTCTATFNVNVVAVYTLTASVINEITANGTASGRIVSNPAGIDCGSDCSGKLYGRTGSCIDPRAGGKLEVHRLDWRCRLQRRLSHPERRQNMHGKVRFQCRHGIGLEERQGEGCQHVDGD